MSYETTQRRLASKAVVAERDSPRLANAKRRLGDALLYRSVTEDIPAEERPITREELDALERVLDQLFAKANIDIEFTRHFFDRVNDPRNVRQITVGELAKVFRATWQQHGRKTIAKKPPDWEALIKDVTTKINIPFVLNYNRRTGDMELVAKTVMRKKNFLTRDPKLVVTSPQESLAEARGFAAALLAAWPSGEGKPSAEIMKDFLRFLRRKDVARGGYSNDDLLSDIRYGATGAFQRRVGALAPFADGFVQAMRSAGFAEVRADRPMGDRDRLTPAGFAAIGRAAAEVTRPGIYTRAGALTEQRWFEIAQDAVRQIEDDPALRQRRDRLVGTMRAVAQQEADADPEPRDAVMALIRAVDRVKAAAPWGEWTKLARDALGGQGGRHAALTVANVLVDLALADLGLHTGASRSLQGWQISHGPPSPAALKYHRATLARSKRDWRRFLRGESKLGEATAKTTADLIRIAKQRMASQGVTSTTVYDERTGVHVYVTAAGQATWFSRHGQRISPVIFKESVNEANSDPKSVRSARRAVQTGVENGSLKRPSKCQLCGSRGTKTKKNKSGLEADHGKGYRDGKRRVRWLCPSCHHKATNRRRRSRGESVNETDDRFERSAQGWYKPNALGHSRTQAKQALGESVTEARRERLSTQKVWGILRRMPGAQGAIRTRRERRSGFEVRQKNPFVVGIMVEMWGDDDASAEDWTRRTKAVYDFMLSQGFHAEYPTGSPEGGVVLVSHPPEVTEARPGQFFEPVGSRAPRKKLRDMDVNELRAELLRLGEHYLVVMRTGTKAELIQRIEQRHRDRKLGESVYDRRPADAVWADGVQLPDYWWTEIRRGVAEVRTARGSSRKIRGVWRGPTDELERAWREGAVDTRGVPYHRAGQMPLPPRRDDLPPPGTRFDT